MGARIARRLALLAAAVATVACGSSPTAPTASPSFKLAAGNYTLNIYAAPRPTTTPGIVVMACISGVGGSAAFSISVPVTVQREGSLWVVRPPSGSLRMALAEINNGVDGSLEGSTSHGGVTVTINPSTGAPASVSAPTLGVSSLGGFVEGDVSFGGGSCSSNAWSLVPR